MLVYVIFYASITMMIQKETRQEKQIKNNNGIRKAKTTYTSCKKYQYTNSDIVTIFSSEKDSVCNELNNLKIIY